MPEPAPPPAAAASTPDLEARGFSFVLETVAARGGARLELRALHRPGYGAICADWLTPDLKRRIAAGRRQPLARAFGLHKRKAGDAPLRVLDATAGLGRDGYVLAALGARLTLAERNPQTCALLRDALSRVQALDDTSRAIGERIEIVEADAFALFGDPANRQRWDAIYLDPMYPDDGKAALPSKEMQLLRELNGGDDDADQLLIPAIICARLRVVVKRPLKAPWIAGIKPESTYEGTQLRFDVYSAARVG